MIAGARRFVRPPTRGWHPAARADRVRIPRVRSEPGIRQPERGGGTARTQIDYPPDGHNVRFLRRGLTQHPYWAVSLWTRRPDGDGYERVTVVVVDARSGEVSEITRGASGA